MTGRSAEEQKRVTAENWAGRAAAWGQWAERMARLAEGLNEPLMSAIGIAPGMHVLDLASGAGEPALTMAARVGPQGEVTASDLVPEMLAVVQARAHAAGLANVRFQQADMEALPFAEASFEAVTCRLGLMYVPNPSRAAGEARRVLRPGGRAAFLVWGPHEDNTQFVVLDDVFHNVMGLEPHEGAFTPTRFGAAGDVTRVLLAAGFAEVEERELRFNPRVDPASRFWRPQLGLRLGDRLERLSRPERERLDAAMAAGFERFRDGDRIQLRVHARLGIGRKH
ncbi:MAG: class I SAM-dependent methyltransferase [Alphaproteobacteria bacterium]|nr:class I SAM-dependent methyltransferase [Alphaproteobacteria bacterium]